MLDANGFNISSPNKLMSFVVRKKKNDLKIDEMHVAHFRFKRPIICNKLV